MPTLTASRPALNDPRYTNRQAECYTGSIIKFTMLEPIVLSYQRGTYPQEGCHDLPPPSPDYVKGFGNILSLI